VIMVDRSVLSACVPLGEVHAGAAGSRRLVRRGFGVVRRVRFGGFFRALT